MSAVHELKLLSSSLQHHKSGCAAPEQPYEDVWHINLSEEVACGKRPCAPKLYPSTHHKAMILTHKAMPAGEFCLVLTCITYCKC